MPPIGSAPNGAVRPYTTQAHEHLNPSLSSPLDESSENSTFPFPVGAESRDQTKLCCSMPGRRAGSSGFFLRDRLKPRNKQTLSLIMFGGALKAS